MPRIQVDMRDDDWPELEAFLGDRLYEFNSRTTGIYDGALLNASVEDESGNDDAIPWSKINPAEVQEPFEAEDEGGREGDNDM